MPRPGGDACLACSNMVGGWGRVGRGRAWRPVEGPGAFFEVTQGAVGGLEQRDDSIQFVFYSCRDSSGGEWLVGGGAGARCLTVRSQVSWGLEPQRPFG